MKTRRRRFAEWRPEPNGWRVGRLFGVVLVQIEVAVSKTYNVRVDLQRLAKTTSAHNLGDF